MLFGEKNSNGVLASKEQKYNQKNVKLYLLGYICATQPLYTIFPFFPHCARTNDNGNFFAVCKEGSKIFQNYNTYIP